MNYDSVIGNWWSGRKGAVRNLQPGPALGLPAVPAYSATRHGAGSTWDVATPPVIDPYAATKKGEPVFSYPGAEPHPFSGVGQNEPGSSIGASGTPSYTPSAAEMKQYAGAPAYLQRAAYRNLTEANAGAAKMNQVYAAHAMPGVGAPGSTAETDRQNMDVASSMARADIGGRFGFGSPEYLRAEQTPRTQTSAERAASYGTSAQNIVAQAIGSPVVPAAAPVAPAVVANSAAQMRLANPEPNDKNVFGPQPMLLANPEPRDKNVFGPQPGTGN